MKRVDHILAGIAREHLHIPTLEPRCSDSLDFHDVAVWQVAKALKAAFEAGCRYVEVPAGVEGQDEAGTWTQAVENGLLVDVTATAREAGIKYPVALTRAVWGHYVDGPAGGEGRSLAARLWDVVWSLANAIYECRELPDIRHYRLAVRINSRERKPVTLKAVCGLDDDGSPCITVKMPDEA